MDSLKDRVECSKTQLLQITILRKYFAIKKIATKHVIFKSLKKRQASLQFHFKCCYVEVWCSPEGPKYVACFYTQKTGVLDADFSD